MEQATNSIKVLLVEDEETLSNIVKNELTDAGYNVLVAKDGEDALLVATNSKPDIVLLDLVLPKKGGIDVLEDFKKNELLKNIPVIILSNLAESESIKKALSLGAKDYFIKSQHPISDISEKIKEYIS